MGKTVLVVDDYPDVLELIEALISREGFDVVKAKNALSAQNILEETIPDAIVLDIMMPDRTGVELLENIRWEPRLAQIPVICISAARLSGEVLDFIQEFSLGLVDKAKIQDLVVKLREVLGKP